MSYQRKTLNRRKTKNYTFHSYGTHFSFNPSRFIQDDRFVNESGEFETMKMLQFYKNEVKMAKCPHVYILTDKGEELSV